MIKFRVSRPNAYGSRRVTLLTSLDSYYCGRVRFRIDGRGLIAFLPGWVEVDQIFRTLQEAAEHLAHVRANSMNKKAT